MTVPKFLGSFEYKYIVRSLEYDETSTHNSLCRWEDGPTRNVDLKSVKEDILLKNDASVTFPTIDMLAVTPQARIAAPPGASLVSVGMIEQQQQQQ